MDVAREIEERCQEVSSAWITKTLKNINSVNLREASLNRDLVLCKVLRKEVSVLYKSIDLEFLTNSTSPSPN